MALKFKCQNCSEDIVVKFLRVGEIAKCRSCGKENAVSETATEKVEAPVYPEQDENTGTDLQRGKFKDISADEGKEEIYGKERVNDILKYLEAPKYMKEHHEFISGLRRRDALKGVGAGIGMFLFSIFIGIIGALVSLIAKSRILMSVSAIVFVSSIVVFLYNTFRLAASSHSPIEEIDSIKDVCTKVYKVVLFERELPKDLFLDKCADFVPIPVLENYLKGGWLRIRGYNIMPPNDSVECSICHKMSPSSRIPRAGEIWQEPKHGEVDYFRCEYCSTVLCNDCGSLDALCPYCEKATGGWDGLLHRWESCRSVISNTVVESSKFVDIDIKKHLREDPRIVDLDIYVKLEHNLVKFRNTALKFHGKPFLVSPEPYDITIEQCGYEAREMSKNEYIKFTFLGECYHNCEPSPKLYYKYSEVDTFIFRQPLSFITLSIYYHSLVKTITPKLYVAIGISMLCNT
jgi:hypothetical protein